MLLLSPLCGFLILVTLTNLSHAVPKDIHIYLHGLGNSANNPKMIYPSFDDHTPPVEAGNVETNMKATDGGEGEENNRKFDRSFNDDECPPTRGNKNSYRLIGPLITRQSPCSGNSPKFPSPSEIIPGPNPGCSPPCSGNSRFSIRWPQILPHFTPPPPRIIPGWNPGWNPEKPGCSPPCTGISQMFIPPTAPSRIIPGWNPELPGCSPPCTVISQMIIPPTAPSRIIPDWNPELPGCSPPCNGISQMIIPPTAPPRITYPPFDDHEPPPFNVDWNLNMPGCSPPCNTPILPRPPKQIGIYPQPGCSPPCSWDSGKGQFWSQFVKATSGNSEW